MVTERLEQACFRGFKSAPHLPDRRSSGASPGRDRVLQILPIGQELLTRRGERRGHLSDRGWREQSLNLLTSASEVKQLDYIHFATRQVESQIGGVHRDRARKWSLQYLLEVVEPVAETTALGLVVEAWIELIGKPFTRCRLLWSRDCSCQFVLPHKRCGGASEHPGGEILAEERDSKRPERLNLKLWLSRDLELRRGLCFTGLAVGGCRFHFVGFVQPRHRRRRVRPPHSPLRLRGRERLAEIQQPLV